jgi:hypothetical protein
MKLWGLWCASRALDARFRMGIRYEGSNSGACVKIRATAPHR